MAELNKSVVVITYFCLKCKVDVDVLTGDQTCGRCETGFVEEIRTPLKDKSGSKEEVKTENNASVEDNECSICLTSYKKKDMITKLVCQHRFHKHCVTLWFKEKNNCPLCRDSVNVSSVITPVRIPLNRLNRGNGVTNASIRAMRPWIRVRPARSRSPLNSSRFPRPQLATRGSYRSAPSVARLQERLENVRQFRIETHSTIRSESTVSSESTFIRHNLRND